MKLPAALKKKKRVLKTSSRKFHHMTFLTSNRVEEMENEQRKRVDVPCAFCGGSGKDPFGIMSHLSTCCVCGGRGVVQVMTPHVRCAHCRGSGAVKTFTCTVCRGRGRVPAALTKTVPCPECRGTGDDGSASAMPCLTCRGRGWVESRTE